MTDFLKTISSPKDLKKLTRGELKSLANDVRTRLVDVVTKTGGHLASNLGVVELTIALHKCFDSPTDKIFFDVSHQSYVHKLLTGRNNERFDKIRHSDGYSGFTSPDESAHDNFVAGHAGTALSAALGFAIARDKNNETHNIIAVIGDASMSCGETMEALNQVSTCTRQLIIILNDNEFSIDRNVGALAYCFNEILRSTMYDRIKMCTKRCIKVLPLGTKIIKIARRIKNSIKNMILPMSFFENYGLRYVGPIDGHDFHQLEESLNFCKTLKQPVILHIKTKKGQGFDAAANQPEKFHGISEKTCNTNITEFPLKPYKEIIGETIVSLARNDKKIIGITAAMSNGTGLDHLKISFPDQYIDVGIAE
ncbi:MAG: 1-deoxy-D-xylulose-5-phosphate synthase, partial [Sphingobacteriia bacterium]|nr:1-deoxy-D-xylulose-5-phosphate synthase [Sphingobacteriia bacterium]